MTVSFASFQIARTGLTVSERGLDITGHNISNVNTPGYVRQQANISDAAYVTSYGKNSLFQYGLGADIQQIRQIRHAFMDNLYRQESTTLGYWEARAKTVEDIQSIVAEPISDGLQRTMNSFWNSWQELSKAPDSLTVRSLVRQRAESFINVVNKLGSQLDKLQDDLNSQINDRIASINDITRQVADLNVKILSVEISRDNANDYRDQRNYLVDKLSKMVDVNVMEMQDGQLDITLGGYFLVTKAQHTDLYAGSTVESGLYNVPMLGGTKIQVPIKSGELKGLLESRGEVLGVKGSVANGSPLDKIDLVFAIDRNATASQKTDIITSATNLVAQYKAKGIDVRLGYAEFDGNGVYANNGAIPGSPSFTNNLGDFTNLVNNLGAPGGATPESFEALQSIENIGFRNNAYRQVVLVTNSVGDLTTANINTIATQFNNAGISTSVVGNGTGQTQLGSLAAATKGSYYTASTGSAAEIANITDGLYSEMKSGIYNNVMTTQNIISDIKNRLNLLVNVVAREINSLHRSGVTLDGQPGSDFFVPINSAYPMEMGNIKLNDNLDNLNYIVSSKNGQNGDNTVADSIANLRLKPLIGKTGNEVSTDDFYRSIILFIGNTGSQAINAADSQGQLVTSTDNVRQSISGVSMDEEMTNMMKFKFAYDAASRVVNIIDTMLDTVISRTGLAGR